MKRTPETLAALDAAIALMERTGASHFNMQWTFRGPVDSLGTTAAIRSCGSSACIAGFVELANAPNGRVTTSDWCEYTLDRAAKRLGLRDSEAERLFESNWDATKTEALATLRHLRETGRVKWLRSKPAKTGAA
jgi:hypothetical protein